LTSRIKLLPVLVQLGKDVKLLRAVGLVEVLGLRVADHFGFEFESEGASLELFFFLPAKSRCFLYCFIVLPVLGTQRKAYRVNFTSLFNLALNLVLKTFARGQYPHSQNIMRPSLLAASRDD